MIPSTGREEFPLVSSLVFNVRLNKICISFEILKKSISKHFSLMSKQKSFNASCMLLAETLCGIRSKFAHRLGLPQKGNFSAIWHICLDYSWHGGRGRGKGRNHPVLRGEKADQPARLRDVFCVQNTGAAAKPERGSSGFQNPSQLMEIITSATFPISSSGNSLL